MRNLGLSIVVMLLVSACADAPPKMGADLGDCQVTPTIAYRSDEKRIRVCTPGDTDTLRKMHVQYSMHSDYSGATNSSDDFYARPGEECADMQPGLIPTAVDSCHRYAVAGSQ